MTTTSNFISIEPWVLAILADPVTKQPARPEAFPSKHSVLDTRVFLKHTYGYSTWAEGQDEYEREFNTQWAGQDPTPVSGYRAEIDYDRPIYTHYELSGRILDCGGQARCVNFCLRMWNSFRSTRGYMRPLPVAMCASMPINA